MVTEEHTVVVALEDEGARLDQYLPKRLPQLSRARAQGLISAHHALVNGEPAKPSHRVREGEVIRVSVEPLEPPPVEAERIPLDILYEDEHLLIVNKPAGMVVHPAAGARKGTLVNALMAHYPFLSRSGGADRPGIVHRLDKNTSGLLIIAKSELSHRTLVERIGARKVKRLYRALVYGEFAEAEGTIDAPIGRSLSDRKKMAVTGVRSRESVTHFSVAEKFPAVTYLAVTLATGRTHQIRVHMAYIGHPVVGDTVYGVRVKQFHEQMRPEVVEAIKRLERHMLHAETLEFLHPVTNAPLQFTATPPEEFVRLLDLLRGTRER
jgi:23S rRNA pseudouridine1911/1915/1917 synthase